MMSMQTSQKKKAHDPNLNDCTNCGTIGAKLTCAKCKATHYCSKACQKQHWKNGHKALCVTPEERRPHMMASAADKSDREPFRAADARGNSGECPICLESFPEGTLCTLPCTHEFHIDCVEGLRKQGVQQVCPLCRTLLPSGPEQLFDDATCLYVRMAARHRAEGDSWKPRTTSEKENMAHVVELWTNAANQGHIRAKYNLGTIYLSGSGVAQDYKKALQWTRKAASDQGFVDAQYNLGHMYCNGEGVAQDYNEAVRWFRKAADQGHAKAQSSVGKMYLDGDGVAQDYNEAAQWIRKAADQDFAEAQYSLGNMYRDGKGVTQDYNEAAQWYRKASDQGDADAQINLGYIYIRGDGVAQDYNEAVRWFRKAADKGHAGAQSNLGNMYYSGYGVSQDYSEAMRWYRKSIDQGLAGAQLSLGDMYYRGRGVPQDLKAALFYVSAAEAQGVEGAGELCKDIETTIRLTPSECPDLDAPSPSKCTCCGREAGDFVKLKPCPRCKGPLYCGKDCQSKHWKNGHRERCIKK